MFDKIKFHQLKAIRQLKRLRDRQLVELRNLTEKQQQTLLQFAEKLGINLNKSLKQEFYRKIIHVSSLWIPLLIYFVDAKAAIYAFCVLLFGDLFLEYGNYKKWKWARKTFGLIFYRIMRDAERKKDVFQPTGGMYVLLATILCLILFSKEVAIVSLTVMLVSDTCAALFGRVYGMRKIIKHKSTEGVLAFLVSALLVMVATNFIVPVTYASIVACICATLVEMFDEKVKIDDNVSIPLVVGIILTLLV